MFDGKAFGEEIVSAVKSYVDHECKKLREENAWLKDQLASLRLIIDERCDQAVDVANGAIQFAKGIVIPDCKPIILEEVNKVSVELKEAIAQIPQGADGPPGRDGVDGKDGRDGLDGKDGAPGANGKDGRDGLDGKDGAPGRDGQEGPAGKDGRDGLDGKDGPSGVGLASAIVDREGSLVLVLSDGTSHILGPVVGRDGQDGKDGERGLDGKDGLPGAPGIDGKDGKDGLDGVGFDDMSAEIRDGSLYLMFTRGDVIKEIEIPSIAYRDTWSSEVKYKMGNAVTWGGSLWIAKKDNPVGRPDANGGNENWKLAVKKGRDGRDGRDGKDFTKPVKVQDGN